MAGVAWRRRSGGVGCDLGLPESQEVSGATWDPLTTVQLELNTHDAMGLGSAPKDCFDLCEVGQVM